VLNEGGRSMRGWRKLIDIADGGEHLRRALETHLGLHSIENRVYIHARRSRNGGVAGFTRYWVKQNDLCCAQLIIPALRELGEDRILRGIS
jgi:hypothetical protein